MNLTASALLLPLLLLVLLAALCATLWLLLDRSGPSNLRQRLGVPVAGRAAQELASIVRTGPPLHPALQSLARAGERLGGTAQDRLNLQRLLAQAGYRRPEALGLLLAAKSSCGLLLCMLVVFGLVPAGDRLGLSGLAAGLIAVFAGTTLPELLVKLRAARRHEALARSMPDALDLMVICAEAGLPFPRILKTVARELGLSAPVMADELSYTSAELQLLPDRAGALRHLAERTRVPTIESMVASLVQAERYGTPLAQALRTIAEESRSRLILELEEKAGKLPAQLSLPLMTLILPPVVAIVATPALMRVVRSLLQ
jgi:tight adherence protein C